MNIGDNSFDIKEEGRKAIEKLAEALCELDENSKYIKTTWHGRDYTVSSTDKEDAILLQNLNLYFKRIILDKKNIDAAQKEKILRLYTSIPLQILKRLLVDKLSTVNKKEELDEMYRRFESAKSLDNSYERNLALASVFQELTRKEYFAEALELGKSFDYPDTAYNWIINALPDNTKGFDRSLEIIKMLKNKSQRYMTYFNLIQSSICAGCLEQTNKAIKDVPDGFQTIFVISKQFERLLDRNQIGKVLNAVKEVKDNNIGTYSLGGALISRLAKNEEWLEIAKRCVSKLTQSEINEMISYGLLILLQRGRIGYALDFAENFSAIQNKNFFNENFVQQIKTIRVPWDLPIAYAIEQAPDKNDELRSILEKIRNLI